MWLSLAFVLMIVAMVTASWFVPNKSPRVVMQAFSRAAEIYWSPSIRPPPIPDSIGLQPSCLLIVLLVQFHVTCSLGASANPQMDPSLSSSDKPSSYVNVLMGSAETNLLSAALDQFEETQHKESKQPVQEDINMKTQVSQLTSGANDGDDADESGGGTDQAGENAFRSELAKLLKSNKGAKAVMMILGQLTHSMTSAAAAAMAAAIGTQGPGQGAKTGSTTAGGGAPPTTVTLNGLTLLQTKRTDAKLGAKDVQLSFVSNILCCFDSQVRHHEGG